MCIHLKVIPPPILTAGGAKSCGAIMSQWEAIHPWIGIYTCCNLPELKNYNLNPYLLAFRLKKNTFHVG